MFWSNNAHVYAYHDLRDLKCLLYAWFSSKLNWSCISNYNWTIYNISHNICTLFVVLCFVVGLWRCLLWFVLLWVYHAVCCDLFCCGFITLFVVLCFVVGLSRCLLCFVLLWVYHAVCCALFCCGFITLFVVLCFVVGLSRVPHRLMWCNSSVPLTHWGRDKMADIFQTTFSNAFSWMKMYKSPLKFH